MLLGFLYISSSLVAFNLGVVTEIKTLRYHYIA